MPTAIIGTGKIGTAVATNLAALGEEFIVASRTASDAEHLAAGLGAGASAAAVAEAIVRADAIVFAVWWTPPGN